MEFLKYLPTVYTDRFTDVFRKPGDISNLALLIVELENSRFSKEQLVVRNKH